MYKCEFENWVEGEQGIQGMTWVFTDTKYIKHMKL